MSKRAGAASTKDKSETGSGKKRQRADSPPSQPGEKFSYTFEGQVTLRVSINDMLKVANRVVKGMCAEGQHGNVAQAIKHNYPLGDNVHKQLER